MSSALSGPLKFSDSIVYSTNTCLSTRYLAWRISRTFFSLLLCWVPFLSLAVPSRCPSQANFAPLALKCGASCRSLFGSFHPLSLGKNKLSHCFSYKQAYWWLLKKKIYILKLLLNLCTFWVLPDGDPYISSFSESHDLIPPPNCLPKCPLPKCSFPLQLPYCRPASCLTWRTSLDYPWQVWSQIQPLSALPPRMTSRLNRRCPISCSSDILYVLLTLHKVLSISWLIL